MSGMKGPVWKKTTAPDGQIVETTGENIGSLSIGADGKWTYSFDGSDAADALLIQ